MSVKEAQEVFIAQQIAKGGSSMIDEFIAKLKQISASIIGSIIIE